VAYAGSSGPRSGDELADATRLPPEAQRSIAPTGTSPAPAADSQAPPYPATILGLDVQTLDDVHAGLHGDDAAVAVVGWYIASSTPTCPSSSAAESPGFIAEVGVVADLRTFCLRSGVLIAAPLEAGESELEVVFTRGVAVPSDLDRTGLATRVILVGQVVEAAPLCNGRPTCHSELFVDRVVWAAGLAQAQSTTVLPRLLDVGPRLAWRPRDRIAEATVGRTGAILMETLLDPKTLAAVDPTASELIAARAPRAARIWYRRALGPDPAHDAPLWVAIDDTTATVIGSGSVAPPAAQP